MQSTLNTIFAIAFVIMGLCFAVFHKKIGRRAVNWNKEYFGYSLPEIIHQIAFLVVGIIFAIAGILNLLGIIHFGKNG